jgi:phosphoglycolate phosphatase-like HAD superfamily hydrolase
MAEQHQLILIDHDGTLCQTNNMAFDSIKYAAKVACGGELLLSEADWDSIFSETAGTTEKNFVHNIALKTNFSISDIKKFEQDFYKARVNWYKSMRAHGEFILDTYYPDMENLILAAFEKENFHLMLVTGNPLAVMEERLSNHLRKYFVDEKDSLLGSFGEETTKHSELISKSITKATKAFPGFEPIKGDLGFCENVTYIGDSKHDFVAGLDGKVKTIWIPSRNLYVTKELRSEPYLQVFLKLLDKYTMITNDIFSPETLRFIGL